MRRTMKGRITTCRRTLKVLTSICLCLPAALPLSGQQASPNLASNPVLQRSFAANGSAQISDIALAGTVRRIAGSTDETGRVELKALAGGEARLDLSFPSGTTREVFALSANGPVGEWIGEDGTAHPIAYHNLLTDAAWFCPALVLGKIGRPASERVVTASAAGTSAGQIHDRLHVERRASAVPARIPKEAADGLQRASQFDLKLDPATSLPVEMTFATHPDDNLRQEIPVRVAYSDYRSVNGAQIPFHIEKFINNSLILEIQLETADINGGIAASAFAVSEAASRRHQ